MNIAAIITRNRLPQFTVMVNSLLKYHPDVHFHLLMLDDIKPDHFTKLNSDVSSIEYYRPDEFCNKNDLLRLYSAHNPFELACIFKSLFTKHLLQVVKIDSVVYCDSDLFFTNSISGFISALKKSNALFVPHRVIADTKPSVPSIYQETKLMTTGIFNLGFFGLVNTAETLRFLDWWSQRMLSMCRREPSNGLFDDQYWINSAVVLFDKFSAFRDPGYNVAVWNLKERLLVKTKGQYFALNCPLCFFHFSGFEATQTLFLASYSHIKIPPGSALEELCLEYLKELNLQNYSKFLEFPFSKAMTI